MLTVKLPYCIEEEILTEVLFIHLKKTERWLESLYPSSCGC